MGRLMLLPDAVSVKVRQPVTVTAMAFNRIVTMNASGVLSSMHVVYVTAPVFL